MTETAAVAEIAVRKVVGGVKRYRLRFGLLGPPVLYAADAADAAVPVGDAAPVPVLIPAPTPVASPKARALLAALLLEAGYASHATDHLASA